MMCMFVVVVYDLCIFLIGLCLCVEFVLFV